MASEAQDAEASIDRTASPLAPQSSTTLYMQTDAAKPDVVAENSRGTFSETVSMKIVVGITGSSGAAYALDFLKNCEAEKFLIISSWGKVLLRDELNMNEKDLKPFVRKTFSDDDLTAPMASGSNRWDAFVIIPASTSTIGKIASGLGDTLITRTAQVCLKERYKLIICVRETPMSTLSLDQCARLSRYGAIIMPISPPMYFVPKSVEEYVGAFTAKVLAQLGLGSVKGWRQEEFE